jgi:hypothetical protein
MKYYLKIVNSKNEVAIIDCVSFDDALNTRNAFINYDCNLKITIETKED